MKFVVRQIVLVLVQNHATAALGLIKTFIAAVASQSGWPKPAR
jgi:hypothetical protein